MALEDRRPLKTRSAGWAGSLAKKLTQWDVEPNQPITHKARWTDTEENDQLTH
jgi:hypothetical protein